MFGSFPKPHKKQPEMEATARATEDCNPLGRFALRVIGYALVLGLAVVALTSPLVMFIYFFSK